MIVPDWGDTSAVDQVDADRYEWPDEGCHMHDRGFSTKTGSRALARSPAVTRFEAAVIGAGAAGLAAALALAHKGVAVALAGPPTRGDSDRADGADRTKRAAS